MTPQQAVQSTDTHREVRRKWMVIPDTDREALRKKVVIPDTHRETQKKRVIVLDAHGDARVWVVVPDAHRHTGVWVIFPNALGDSSVWVIAPDAHGHTGMWLIILDTPACENFHRSPRCIWKDSGGRKGWSSVDPFWFCRWPLLWQTRQGRWGRSAWGFSPTDDSGI